MKTATLLQSCHRLLLPKVCLWLGLILFTGCGGNGDLTVGDFPNSGSESISQTDFQIGASWDAQNLTTQNVINTNNFVISQGASSTVLIRTLFAKGTGIFLGRFNNRYLVATNAHVLKNIPTCAVTPVVVQFKLANLAYTCSKVIGIWPDVDFALIALRAQNGSHVFLDQLNPPKMAFKKPLLKNTLLYSFGHGAYLNSENNLTLKAGDDCRIYSEDNTLRRLQDPNQEGAKKVPSFAVGCDISPGDSGSPLIDRTTGDIYGLIWSTQTPKSFSVRSSTYMERLRAENSDEVWSNLAYGVPATAIRDELLRWTERVKRSLPMRERRRAVLDLLGL
jgi:hypothetical protein